jgi:hypothetical protein
MAVAIGSARVPGVLGLPQRFEGKHSAFTISRPAPHVVLVVITGKDVGEHRRAPLDVLEHELSAGPFTLFVDARATAGATIDVSNVWAQWLRAHRDALHRIHMLTGSRFVQLTADFVRRFAELGDTMLIYTDGAAFDEALRSAGAR